MYLSTEEKLYKPSQIKGVHESIFYDQAQPFARMSNPDNSVVWNLLHAAHEEGDKRATYGIAAWYIFGHPTIIRRRNYRKALPYLQSAAESKVPHALYNLALFHELGRVVQKDEVVAFSYYMDAAVRGHPDAINSIGRMLYHGIGIKKNEMLSDVFLDYFDEISKLEK